MDVCRFCLQPGNLFPTGIPSQLACAKCQPYVSSAFESAAEPQVIVSDGPEGPAGSDGVLYCHLCNKTFERNLQYQNHIRNHRAERKFVCPHCQKGFSQSNNLRAHLRIHTNERPFKCSECGKAFTQVTNLNNHIRLHTGEKPFVCKEPGCNRAFAQVTNLNNHKKSHMRDFHAFKCSQCSKTFAQRNHLTSHVQSEHESQICTACGEAFPSASLLLVHNRSGCRERLLQAEKRKLENVKIEQSAKKKSSMVKCLFGDCKMFFSSMEVLQTHLYSQHGLSINNTSNTSKSAKIPHLSSDIIDLDDDVEVPSKSTPSLSRHQQKNKDNGRIQLTRKEQSSSSDSESDSSDEDSDSDGKRNEIATIQMKMVCNKCFSTFDSILLLERHMKKHH